MLQGRIQPNYLLLGKDTFHPHAGTLSSKTNLFPHSQGYSCLSPAPPYTWDNPILSEHDRILYHKAIYRLSFGSFMHIKCQLSSIFTFFFQNVKHPEKKPCKNFLSHLLSKTSNSIVLLAYLSFLQYLDISSREDGIS